MITRTIKYTASDGTEHDSPQVAAQYDLRLNLIRASGLPRYQAETTARYMAENPEAMRDALDTYFEDLEAHPDSPAAQAFDDMVRTGMGVMRVDPASMFKDPPPEAPPHPSGLVLTEKALKYTGLSTGHTVHDWLAQGWTRQQLIDQGMAVEVASPVDDPLDPDRIEVGEIAPGVRGFEMEVASHHGQLVSDAQAHSQNLHKTGSQNVDDPTYCRPFGTRED